MKNFLLFATGISFYLYQLPTDFIPQTFCRIIFIGTFGRRDAYGIHQ